MIKSSYLVTEVADLLKVSRRTVYRAIENGEIHSFKFGHSRRIEAEEIDRLKKKDRDYRGIIENRNRTD